MKGDFRPSALQTCGKHTPQAEAGSHSQQKKSNAHLSAAPGTSQPTWGESQRPSEEFHDSRVHEASVSAKYECVQCHPTFWGLWNPKPTYELWSSVLLPLRPSEHSAGANPFGLRSCRSALVPVQVLPAAASSGPHTRPQPLSILLRLLQGTLHSFRLRSVNDGNGSFLPDEGSDSEHSGEALVGKCNEIESLAKVVCP
ncbi:hypothetical protein MJT46_012108 [Ovis ammon polii x Ovis aries]|nr:hypothetical protein MJT46_012108 [Ovis ammon polii x Ovis aries]